PSFFSSCFCSHHPSSPAIYTLSLHDALPIWFTVWQSIPFQFLLRAGMVLVILAAVAHLSRWVAHLPHLFGAVAQESLLIYFVHRSEEHTSELQSPDHLVCRLLLEKKNNTSNS